MGQSTSYNYRSSGKGSYVNSRPQNVQNKITEKPQEQKPDMLADAFAIMLEINEKTTRVIELQQQIMQEQKDIQVLKTEFNKKYKALDENTKQIVDGLLTNVNKEDNEIGR